MLIFALVNPHDVQEYPGRGRRGIALSPTFTQGGYRLEDFRDFPIDLPESVEDELDTKPSVHDSFRKFLGLATGHVNTRERQLVYTRFYAYLNKLVDSQILKVLEALDAYGLTDNTPVVRTSDHGELGMAHGRGRQKSYNIYREALQVPLIFSNPRLFPKPQTSSAFAGLVDLLPTFASIGGVCEPEQFGFQGHDLTPVLSSPRRSVQAFLPFTHEDDAFPVSGADCIRTCLDDDWKYGVYYDPLTGSPAEYEMYDVNKDPWERKKLAHANHRTSATEKVRARLHKRLLGVMTELGTVPDEIRWPGFDGLQG